MYDGSAGGVQGWRVVVVFRDADSTPKESFVYHAAGNAGRGLSSCIDRVILRDRDPNGGAEADAADDALFDESYAANVGLSGKGRVSSAGVGVGVGNCKGYAGYEHDESLTMYQVRHRVYRPDLGRWMTRDPLGYVDGMSLYEYVAGMAVFGRDFTGLFSWRNPQECATAHERNLTRTRKFKGSQCILALRRDLLSCCQSRFTGGTISDHYSCLDKARQAVNKCSTSTAPPSPPPPAPLPPPPAPLPRDMECISACDLVAAGMSLACANKNIWKHANCASKVEAANADCKSCCGGNDISGKHDCAQAMYQAWIMGGRELWSSPALGCRN